MPLRPNEEWWLLVLAFAAFVATVVLVLWRW